MRSHTTCPGLFYPTPAQDGILSRIRIPGGIVDTKQFHLIADIADRYGGGYVDVTNRANLQVREISTEIDAEVLQRLQDVNLGSRNQSTDHIRNIMTSPTAGIDIQELIDTRNLVKGWDNYIVAHPNLSGLSAKFSICFDGGGRVSVSDRLNDIGFFAVIYQGNVCFRLHLSVGKKGEPPKDMEILLRPEQCLPVLAALADVYLRLIDMSSLRKTRLRELLNTLGVEQYLQEVEKCLSFTMQSVSSKAYHSKIPTAKYEHIGVHPQRQSGFSYIGVVLPLGRLKTFQIRKLADLAERCKNSTLRLTPWQNLLLSHIPNQDISNVQGEIERLGLDWSVSNLRSAIVACSGKTGCVSSATDTKSHALLLANYLGTRLSLNQPVNIHFSGCEKSCAQHSRSDITLLGVSVEEGNRSTEGYHIYVGDGGNKFGRELYDNVTFAKLPMLIEQMLQVYQLHRLTPDESFGEFTNRYEVENLKLLFNCEGVESGGSGEVLLFDP